MNDAVSTSAVSSAVSTAVSTEEWEAWRSFRGMTRKLELALERQLQRDADISAADYGVLMTLLEAPDRQLRAREIGATLLWEKSRVSHQVSRMEKRGLVERRECETDARGSWIGLTTAGKRAVLGAMRDHAATIRRYLFDVLDPTELAAFKDVSDRVVGVIDPEICEIPES